MALATLVVLATSPAAGQVYSAGAGATVV